MDHAGYDVKLVEQPNVSLSIECTICQLILRTPRETTCCNNFFCKNCIKEYQRRGKVECPICRKKLKFREAPAIERLIKQLKVYCKHQDKGCKWEGELGELKKHINENPSANNRDTGCDFTDVECPVCHDPVQRVNLSLHRSDECPNEKIQCNNHEMGCEWRGQRKKLPEHLNIEPHLDQRFEGCGYVKLNCIHECINCVKLRGALKQHEAECPLEPVKCEFLIVGCEAEFPRKNIQDHLSQSMDEHVHLVCQDYPSFRHAIRNEHSSQLQSLSDNLQALRNEYSAQLLGLSDNLQDLGSRVHNLQEIFGNDIDLQAQNHQRHIELLKSKHTDDIKSLKTKFRSLKTKFNYVCAVGGILVVVLIGMLIAHYQYEDLPVTENFFASHPKLSENPYLLPAKYYVNGYGKFLAGKIESVSSHTFVPFAGVLPTKFYFTASHYVLIQDGSPVLQMCFHKIGDSDSLLATVYIQLMNKTHYDFAYYKLNFTKPENYHQDSMPGGCHMKKSIYHPMYLYRIRILSMELDGNKNPPFAFSMCQYHYLKSVDKVWTSNPFYSSPGGFEFDMEIYPNGYGAGRGNYLSFFITTWEYFTGSIEVLFRTSRKFKDIEHTLHFNGKDQYTGVTLPNDRIDTFLQYDCIFFSILNIQVL